MINTKRDPSRRMWVCAVALVGLGITAVRPLGVRQDLGWIDSVSGSRKSQTVWVFGVSSIPAISVSPLESCFRKMGLVWQPDWRRVSGTYVNIFGSNVGYEHSQPPEIYALACITDLQKAFVASSTADELRTFFRLMTSATPAEQKAKVEDICHSFPKGEEVRQ